MVQWLECPTLSSNFPPEKVHGLRVTGSNPGTGKKNGKKRDSRGTSSVMTWVWPGPQECQEVRAETMTYNGGSSSEDSLLSSSPRVSFY